MSETTGLTPGMEMIPVNEIAKAVEIRDKSRIFLTKAAAKVKALGPVKDEASKDEAFAIKAKIKQAVDTWQAERMPFTRKLNEIIKEFTSTEGALNGLIADIDKSADKWAKEELEKARAKQKELDAKLQAEKDAIAFDGRCKEVLRQNIEKLLDAVRTGAGDLVDKVTKGNLATTKTRLSTEVKWKEDHTAFYRTKPDWVTDAEKFDAIAKAEFETNKADYLTRAKSILDDALRILDVAVNDKAEATRLQEIAAQEQAAAAALVATEEEKDIEAQQALAELDMERVEAPKVKTKMKVEILNNAAWLQFMSFWYTNDPDSKTMDCSKKTFAQLKTFVENSCNKGNDVLEHASFRWVEDVKAK